jgi:hypothetical protein
LCGEAAQSHEKVVCSISGSKRFSIRSGGLPPERIEKIAVFFGRAEKPFQFV